MTDESGESPSGQSAQVGAAGRPRRSPEKIIEALDDLNESRMSDGTGAAHFFGDEIKALMDGPLHGAISDVRATIAAQQQEIARLMAGRGMDSTARGRAYETEREWIVCGTPDEHEGLDENDPRHHNCDAMGCGQDHVLARWPKSGLVNATLERAATLALGFSHTLNSSRVAAAIAAAIRALKTTEGA